MENRRFYSNGTEIAYTLTGSPQDGKKSIIFVHGNGENGGIFAEIAQKLQPNWAVFCPDSRGHGNSGKVKRLHYEDIADDIAALIRHECLQKPTLFGFSDGGIVGLIIAAKYPNLLEKVLVAGINLTPKGCKSWLRALQAIGFFFLRSDKLRLMLKEPNITTTDLKKITAETVVFYAQKDAVKRADSETVVATVPNSKLVFVENENHASYVLNNTKLYNLLTKYL